FAVKLIFVAVKLIPHRNHDDEYLAIGPIGLAKRSDEIANASFGDAQVMRTIINNGTVMLKLPDPQRYALPQRLERTRRRSREIRRSIEIIQSAHGIEGCDGHDDCFFVRKILVANTLRHVVDAVGIDAGVAAGEVAAERLLQACTDDARV